MPSRSVLVAITAGLAGIAALAVPKLSVFALLGIVVASLLLRAEPGRRIAVAFLALGAIGDAGGLLRFIIEVAMPGIVEGGQSAAVAGAVSKLREIRTAEDAMRTHAWWDPDHDGIGSAGSLTELSGAAPLRGRVQLDVAPLHARFGDVVKGEHGDVAVIDDYCFAVFVPDDDETAERRYVAYAWPGKQRGRGPAVFLDEHERIYVTDNAQGYVGTEHMPTFDAALATSSWAAGPPDEGAHSVDRGAWKVWRKKKAMTSLAGDEAHVDAQP